MTERYAFLKSKLVSFYVIQPFPDLPNDLVHPSICSETHFPSLNKTGFVQQCSRRSNRKYKPAKFCTLVISNPTKLLLHSIPGRLQREKVGMESLFAERLGIYYHTSNYKSHSPICTWNGLETSEL